MLVAAGSCLGLSACSGKATSTESEEVASVTKTLSVSESQVVSVADFDEENASDRIAQTDEFDIPMGTILYMDAPIFSAAIMPTGDGRQLVSFGFLDTDTGEVSTALASAVGEADGFSLYDFRANDSIAIWDEVNFVSGDWNVYISYVGSDHVLKAPILVESGDENFDPPLLCVSGAQAFYTVLPDENGTASAHDSYLKSVNATDGSPEVVYTSQGRMITNPQATDGIVTFVPRASASGVYYQMTAMDVDSHSIEAAEVLPKSLKVSDAVYMDGAFAFNIEQSYSSGGGIANFGTYRAMSDGDYLRFNRTPTDTPAIMGDYLFIKGTRTIAGVNPAKRTYYNITAVDGCIDYGDYLASTGEVNRIVTFTNVPTGDGSGNGTTHVRVFKSV